MLKTIVDETSHGKYDFMYLRIGKKKRLFFSCLRFESRRRLTVARKDFANNCKYVMFECFYGVYLADGGLSVGYAFINFEDVSLIAIFAIHY